MDLTERDLQMPVGGPRADDFGFCGLLCSKGSLLGEAHRWCRCFQPMSARRATARAKPATDIRQPKPDSDVWPFSLFVVCVEGFSNSARFFPVCRAQLRYKPMVRQDVDCSTWRRPRI